MRLPDGLRRAQPRLEAIWVPVRQLHLRRTGLRPAGVGLRQAFSYMGLGARGRGCAALSWGCTPSEPHSAASCTAGHSCSACSHPPLPGCTSAPCYTPLALCYTPLAPCHATACTCGRSLARLRCTSDTVTSPPGVCTRARRERRDVGRGERPRHGWAAAAMPRGSERRR